MRLSLLLVVLALVAAAPAAAEDKPKQAALGGALVARTVSSVTVKDGARTLTCALAPESPKVGDYRIGDRVKIMCANGILVAIARTVTAPKAPPTAPPVVQTAAGVVSAVSETALTLHTDGGEVTCRLGDASPKLGDLHVGERAKMQCTNGVLTAVARLEEPKPTPPAARTGVGVVVEVAAASVTFHTESGDVHCALGASSPSVRDLHAGDRVKFACAADVLTAIAKLDAPAPVLRGAAGTLSALSAAAISVTTDGGVVTCTLGPKSPPTGDLHVGDHVKMLCTDGVLTNLARL